MTQSPVSGGPDAEERNLSGTAASTPDTAEVVNQTRLGGTVQGGRYDAPTSLADLLAYCELLSKSTIVPVIFQGNPANVFAAALRAQALDIPWFLAIQETFVGEDGRTGMTALLTNYLLTRAGCHITVVQSDATRCIIRMTRPDRPGTVYEETWTIAEAAVAGLAGEDLWVRFPTDSLFARCMARLGRHFGADITMGMSYTREEIAEMNRDRAKGMKTGPVDIPDGVAEFLEQVAAADTSGKLRVLWAKASKQKWLGLVVTEDGRTVEQILFDRGDLLAAQEEEQRRTSTVIDGETVTTLSCGCDPDEVLAQGTHGQDCTRKVVVV